MQTKNIIQLADGSFVADWQYSQGYFTFNVTSDPLKACAVSEENFKTHFQEDRDLYGKKENAPLTVVGSRLVSLAVAYAIGEPSKKDKKNISITFDDVTWLRIWRAVNDKAQDYYKNAQSYKGFENQQGHDHCMAEYKALVDLDHVFREKLI